MITNTEKRALEQAINIVGGQTALAKKLGVRQQTVFVWLKNGLPVRRVLQVEQATNRQISRYQLKPSFYPLDNQNIPAKP
jgi:DNA-binding transcriptional regulator YdaS (Cro superfamily)